MKISTVVSALAVTAALTAPLAAAPQGTTTKSKSTTQTKTTEPAKPTVAKTKAAGATREAVTTADLPAAVTTAVQTAHPKGTIASAMKVTKGADVWYEVSVKDGAKTSKVMVNADGKLQTAPAKAKTK